MAGVGWIGWKNAGIVSAIVHPPTMWALAVTGIFSAGVALLTWIELDSRPTGTADREDIVGLLIFGAAAVVATIALGALMRVKRMSIDPLGVTLTGFLNRTLPAREHSRQALPPANSRRGVLCLLLGILWLAVLTLIPDDFFRARHSSVYVPLAAVGYFLLIYARHYFQPDFQTLITTDRRPPVLFLRSFADDEKVNYLRADRAFIDYSLESRLAGYFALLGPFITVGSPKDKTPHLGAARASLSDADWQNRVVEWMYESQIILLVAGASQWIVWELRKLVESGHVAKLILLFPQIRSPLFWRKRKDAERRLAVVRQAFSGTVWEAGLMRVDRPLRIRSVVFEPGGGVVVVTSRPRNRDSYHLAALIAHYWMLR